MEIREKTAPKPHDNPREFVMSDESVDRMGDVIEAKGWMLDAIKTPPPALFNHNKDIVLGNWHDLRIERGRLIGRIKWMETDYPIVRYARELVDQEVLRTVSVGFQPEASEPLDPKHPHGGRRFKRQQLLECSIVTVPANPNAIAIARSLNIPHDIESSLFCKPATEQQAIDRAFHGKPAAPPLETKRVSTMSHAQTIATKIQTTQQNLNAILASYEELAGKPDLNEDETKRYRDELPAQINATRAELESHKQAERILVGGGTETRAVTTPPAHRWPNPGATTGQERTGPERVTHPGGTAQEPGILRSPVQGARRLDQGAGRTRRRSRPTLRDMYKDGKNTEFTAIVLRAAVNPANTTVATWAAELIQTDTQPFLDRLMADSIYLPLAAAGVRYTFGNAGVLKIPVRASTGRRWPARGPAKAAPSRSSGRSSRR